MKTIYNKIFAALAFAALLSPTACVEEAPIYEPAEPVGNAEVYFPSTLETSYNLKDYDGKLNIEVKRVDTAGEITIPLTVTADEIFSLPSSVKFLAGAESAGIVLSYDLSKVEAEKEYPVSIVLGSDTTPYGISKYEFTVSIPAAWTKWTGDDGTKSGKVHVTEMWWDEDETEQMYYQDLGDDLWYCYIENCWDTGGGATAQNYYFYWDRKTNYLSVPMQYMGYTTSDGLKVYASDAEGFYSVYFGEEWLESKGGAEWLYDYLEETRPYYDGNGGFYLASYFAFGPEAGDKFGSGYQFGGDMDVAIAEGYVRTVDYNDDDHFGASSALYDGEATSMFFASDTLGTAANFETQMRYDASYLDDVKEGEEVAEGTTTTYYLKDYFGEGYGLAFTAPVPELLADGSEISDVKNDQFTGIAVFGNPVYVSVKKGSFSFEEGNEFPVASIVLKVFSKNEAGEKVFDFDQVEEIFEATGHAKDNYTIEDIYGGPLDSYLGTWTMVSYDYFDEKDYAYDVTFSDAGKDSAGNQLVKVSNMSGVSKYFDDSFTAYYRNSALYVYPQGIEGTYNGNSISLCTFDPESEKIYNSAYVLGGICSDGNLAFVNAYDGYNISGFAYYIPSSKTYLSIISNIRGLMEDTTSASVPENYVALRPEKGSLKPFGNAGSQVKLVKKSGARMSAAPAARTFSLSPVEKSVKDFTEVSFK